MVKNIRFGLKMKDDVEVRNLSGLRENFDIEKTLEYAENGKLDTMSLSFLRCLHWSGS